MATAVTAPAAGSSLLQEILGAILVGLQIAVAALPVVEGYQGVFGSHPAHFAQAIDTQLLAAGAHQVTREVVAAALTPPAVAVPAVA